MDMLFVSQMMSQWTSVSYSAGCRLSTFKPFDSSSQSPYHSVTACAGDSHTSQSSVNRDRLSYTGLTRWYHDCKQMDLGDRNPIRKMQDDFEKWKDLGNLGPH